MANLNIAQISGIVALAMIISGAVVVTTPSKTYYCQPEDNVKECIRLSSTNVSCYFLKLNTTVSDICSNGKWEPIEKYIKFPIKPEDNKLQNVSIVRPIVMTNAEILKDSRGIEYIQGQCISTLK